jgi:hypothetical protein
LEDEYPRKNIISGALLSFRNGGSASDRNVSLKVYLPGVRTVSCESDRVHVVEGGEGLGSTFINILIPEITPEEKLSCRVEFTQIVNYAPSVTDWKKRFGPVIAWSELRGEFEGLVYRMSFGPEQNAPKGSSKLWVRKSTTHVK